MTTPGTLQPHIDDWRHLHQMTQQLLRAATANAQIQIVLETTLAFLHTAKGLVSTFDADARGLTTRASLGLSDEGLSTLRCVAVGDGACGRAFKDNCRVLVEDTETDLNYEKYRQFARDQGIRAVCSTPFCATSGEPIGVLSIYFHAPWTPNPRETQLVDICVGHLSLIVERAKVEEALSEEQYQIRQLLDSMNEGFIVTDRDLVIKKINTEVLRLDGRSAEELVGRTIWELWHSAEKLEATAAYRRVMAERAPLLIEKSYTRAGEQRWLEVRAVPAGEGLALFYRDITTRKETERAKEESERRLKQLANSIPQLAWMAHADGWIHWYNERWYDYTGTEAADMEGWGWQSVHDPDFLPRVMELWPLSIKTGQPFQMTFPLRAADGSYRPFFTLVSPLRDESGTVVQWFGTNTDVSPLHNAEQALRKSEERLQEGLTAGRMMVWESEVRTRKFHFLSNAASVFGADWDASAPGWDNVHPDDRQRLADATSSAIARCGKFHELVRMVRPSGILWLEVRGKVVCDEYGVPDTIQGVSLDVTERKQAEEELQEAGRRKDEFLAMLAHELRNPLAPISSAAQILKMPGLDSSRIRQTSDIITRQVQHMSSLVDDLLDVSRVTRGLVVLEQSVVDIRQIFGSAIEQVRALIDVRRHTLTVRTTADPALVRGDRIRLVQVLVNLLNNSAKYTPQHGEIQLAMDVDNSDVVITVSDNGMGIESALLPRVFDLFAQGERTPDRTQGGLGLGLALVSSLVGLHSGIVTAESGGPGKGSTFTVRLPRVHAVEPLVAVEAAQALEQVRTPLRIVVVDDNADAAHSLATLLAYKGHRVSVNCDANSALTEMPVEPVHAFVLDIGLPDMDGYELARKIRALPGTASSVLIALTGYGQVHDRVLSKAAGFDHHFVKPADIAALSAVLEQIRDQDTAASLSRES